MGYTSSGGTDGLGVFNNTPSTVADLNQLRDLIARMGNVQKGNQTDRDGISGDALFQGLLFTYTDQDRIDRYDGAGWVPIYCRIAGSVVRSATGPSLSTSAWFDVSDDTYWSADVAEGISAYSDGWTIPLTGRYRVSYELRASGAFAAGVVLNSPTPPIPTTSVIMAQSASVIQGVIGFAAAGGSVHLTAGTLVRLVAIRDSGTPLMDQFGRFSVEWVGAD